LFAASIIERSGCLIRERSISRVLVREVIDTRSR